MSEERDLERCFAKAGRVVIARICREPRSGHSRGFGFVGFERERAVDEVRRALLCLDRGFCWRFGEGRGGGARALS